MGPREVDMMTLLTGWPGRVQPAPLYGRGGDREPQPQRRWSPADGLRCRIERLADAVAVTAATTDLALQKIVFADGHADAVVRCGRDVVRLTADRLRVQVRRGTRATDLDLRVVGESARRRLRALLLNAPAVRALRAVAAMLEDAAAQAPGHLAVRLSASAFAYFDGDDGAFRRLARELDARASPPPLSSALSAEWPAFHDVAAKAGADLLSCGSAVPYSSPMHAACGVGWMLQVEAAWYSYVRSLEGV
jgi:hypothetical protein